LARIVAPVLIRWGTEEQKSRILAGDHPGANLRLAGAHRTARRQRYCNCQTKAIRDGDHYVVNGQKVMVGHHLPPDYLWTLVCTNPQGKRHENLAWLHIPAKPTRHHDSAYEYDDGHQERRIFR
jgi:alkylation response protein AidB-like acyl-CoA dehydrogenase